MKKIYQDYIYITACSLNGVTPKLERIRNMDISQLFKMSKHQNMVALLAFGLEPLAKDLEKGIWSEWEKAKDAVIRKNLLFDAERMKILSFMEENEIWYLPIKGSVIQKDYTKYGMREMVDNDILYDGNFCRTLYDHMLARGYRYEKGIHVLGHYVTDEYLKEPFYNFEFHTRLFENDILNGKAEQYYSNIDDKKIKDQDNLYGYHLCPEDTWIYLMVHTYKHFINNGVGLRALGDFYVMEQKHKLDYDKIQKELEKLGIADFGEKTRKTCQSLFLKPDTIYELNDDDVDIELIQYLFSSGTFGNQDQRSENRMNEYVNSKSEGHFSKLGYLLSRVFPSMKYMKYYSPTVKKHPWTVPFFYFRRIILALIHRRKGIRLEMKHLIEKDFK